MSKELIKYNVNLGKKEVRVTLTQPDPVGNQNILRLSLKLVQLVSCHCGLIASSRVSPICCACIDPPPSRLL